MKSNKLLKLKALEVKSFTTTFDNSQAARLAGGQRESSKITIIIGEAVTTIITR